MFGQNTYIAELTEPFGINIGRYAPVKIDYAAIPVAEIVLSDGSFYDTYAKSQGSWC